MFGEEVRQVARGRELKRKGVDKVKGYVSFKCKF